MVRPVQQASARRKRDRHDGAIHGDRIAGVILAARNTPRALSLVAPNSSDGSQGGSALTLDWSYQFRSAARTSRGLKVVRDHRRLFFFDLILVNVRLQDESYVAHGRNDRPNTNYSSAWTEARRPPPRRASTFLSPCETRPMEPRLGRGGSARTLEADQSAAGAGATAEARRMMATATRRRAAPASARPVPSASRGTRPCGA
jgi:hypothetical protein